MGTLNPHRKGPTVAKKSKISAYLAPTDHEALTRLTQATGQTLGDLIADMTILTVKVREIAASGSRLQVTNPTGEVTQLEVIGRAFFVPPITDARSAQQVLEALNSPEGKEAARRWAQEVNAMPVAELEARMARYVPKDAP